MRASLIVLAISSRIYVEAAVKAGFAVIAIDAFADMETKRLATKSYQVDFAAGQLNTRQILNILATLDLTEVIGICYGAGFESQADWLAELAKTLPVLGNGANTVERCKAPDSFFTTCKLRDILTPETRLTPPENPDGWLQKMVGGGGGAHIAALGKLNKNKLNKNEEVYYQRFQPGMSFSCLFLANSDFVQIIGFNEQWVDENVTGAFCYGGAVSHAEIDDDIKEHAIRDIRKLCQRFELKGLNSCDFIVNDKLVYLLEVNPRLSASLDLYENGQAVLMQAHIDVFEKDLREAVILPLLSSKAHQIVYAKTDTIISKTAWPAWVSDIPAANMKIAKGAPICTINAVADNASAAKQLLKQRVVTLNF